MNLPGRCIRGLVSLTLVVVLLVSGCSQHTAPVSLPVIMPDSFSESGTAVLQDKWWLAFNDEALNALIEQALNDNFSLKSSWDRLNQARAVYRKSGAALSPTLDGEAYGRSSAARTGEGGSANTDYLSLALSAQYEIDLWGRIGSTVDAARLDMQASQADLDAAAMTLSSVVAETWYNLVEKNSSIMLLDEQIGINRMGLELVTAQFRTGQVPIADVLQQRQLIESRVGEKARLVASRAVSEDQLNILLGRAPGTSTFEIPKDLIELPELPVTGIPAEFILARPDIRSALYGVEAADKRVAAAIAERFPALRLTASLETSGNYGGDIFSSYLAAAAASLVGPIVDGGLRKAEVERARAAALEKLHNYGQAILVAVGEVEEALVQEKQQKRYIESLRVQLELATRTMEQVKDRYLKGVENYERVLTALTSLQTLQQDILAAENDLLVNRIQLCRALGKGWNYSEPEVNS